MFEIGMSALVLKICSEYAKALGLNFPPCVQQEINAIAQYVDLHTVKDLRVEQNGSVVTITCYTEGEQEKVFTVTLPEVNVDVLFNLIKGSSSVVVEKSEDGTHLIVRLDQSVINNINSKLVKPANPTYESAVTMLADGTVGTKLLSEIGGVQFVEVYGDGPIAKEKLDALKANKANQIIYYGGVKYCFKLAYEKSNNEWVYSTFVNSAATLTVNMTTGSTTFNNVDRRYYRHLLKGTAAANFVTGSSVTSPVEYEMIFITDSVDSMKVDDSTVQNDILGEYQGCYITAYGTVSVISEEMQGNYYAFDACGFEHEDSSSMGSVNYLYMYDPTKYGELDELTKVSAQIITVDSDTITEL